MVLMGFWVEPRNARLTLLAHSFPLRAVGAVYRNRKVLNNIIKLQNINGDINGMLTEWYRVRTHDQPEKNTLQRRKRSSLFWDADFRSLSTRWRASTTTLRRSTSSWSSWWTSYKALFPSSCLNGPHNLECFITLELRSFSVTNALVYWAHSI